MTDQSARPYPALCRDCKHSILEGVGMRVHIDRFSGHMAELPRGKRTTLDALRALSTDPRVSVFDRGTQWLESLIHELIGCGWIAEDLSEPYPWCRFNLTDAGRAALERTT